MDSSSLCSLFLPLSAVSFSSVHSSQLIRYDTSHKTIPFTFFVKHHQRLSLSPLPDFLSSVGPLYCDCCLPAFLLLGVLLLGAYRGMAVLPGCHWQDEVKTHSKAFSVPRLGWALTVITHYYKHGNWVQCGTLFWFVLQVVPIRKCCCNVHLCVIVKYLFL